MSSNSVLPKREGIFVVWGLVLWLAATLIFRFFGHFLMDAGSPVLLGTSFILAVPLIYGCIFPLYALLGVPSGGRIRMSVRIALPGMFLDIFSLAFHSYVFPSLPPEGIPLLAAWLLWAYGLILATGRLPKS
ncbi:DUF5367 family protein [Paenibacillus mucilaginosus]|uniref:Uncharacterized protein n=1 Tax=Paenibacillus mucilaginosus (strain KNP414) TaxID=1036673 RepID=F8FL13_PAEMK|nr:DUF5367 family protein [Paenibacillus mucilaginosus]AEI38873.1 hypothetical protein KNP414_00232 [Paenibacillus mucilaginosus KNP414]MCG7217303.1 DUF5367 domain-containing protein [Paenibacillus mucilaginosus]